MKVRGLDTVVILLHVASHAGEEAELRRRQGWEGDQKAGPEPGGTRPRSVPAGLVGK